MPTWTAIPPHPCRLLPGEIPSRSHSARSPRCYVQAVTTSLHNVEHYQGQALRCSHHLTVLDIKHEMWQYQQSQTRLWPILARVVQMGSASNPPAPQQTHPAGLDAGMFNRWQRPQRLPAAFEADS